jgi:hypothetical protein
MTHTVTHRTSPQPPTTQEHLVRRQAYIVSALLAAVTAAASAPTLLVDGILFGPAVMRGSARGTALVLLFAGVPLLLACPLAVRRASATWARRSFLVWVGVAGYVVYNAVMLVLGTPFNSLFLLYEAMLCLGIALLLSLLAGLDPAPLAPARAPYRAAAVWVAFVAVANAAVWLRAIVPALPDPAHAAFLEGTGLLVFPTHVQDLAFWLPLAGLLAVWLWRRLPWGFVLGTALLVYYVLEGVGVAVDQWMGSAADPASTVATRSAVWLFVVVTLLDAVPAVAMLRAIHRDDGTPPALADGATTDEGERR